MKTKRRWRSKRMEDYFKHMRYKRLRKDRLPTFRHSKDYQLGWYIGESIYFNYLPTTDVDMLTTNHIIPLIPEDKIEYERLHKEWSNYSMSNYGDKKDKDPVIKAESKRLFEIQRNFWHQAAKKVLPAILECNILPLPRRLDLLEFKSGLAHYLWDCDRCSYSIKHEDIIIGEQHGFQYIKLLLDV